MERNEAKPGDKSNTEAACEVCGSKNKISPMRVLSPKINLSDVFNFQFLNFEKHEDEHTFLRLKSKSWST